MGPEPFILALWVIQGIVAAALALRSALTWRWFAAIGTVAGFCIGVSPFVVMRGRETLGPAILIMLASVVMLILAYAIAQRWKVLVAVLVILAIPQAYQLFVYRSFPPASMPVILEPIALVAQTAFFLGPITCALALREIAGWLDSLCKPKEHAT